MILVNGKSGEGNGGTVKTFVSTTRTLPSPIPGGYTGYYTETINHDLGVIPDKIDIMMTGDTPEGGNWYDHSGPYCQYGHMSDYSWVPNMEISDKGCGVYYKSATQFKVMFQRLWGGTKVFYKAYVFGGENRSS
jgi:hypothetical protein